ncbi:MAG TPA: NlpC/P60 family protein [Candidatus Nanopelagicales bacterium]|nr:NlpC/P60 family protein [Candidatus Nanopelagicales bacterium]
MASARARFGASLGLALAATLLPVAAASAAPAPDLATAPVLSAPVVASRTVVVAPAATTAVLPRVGATGRVYLSAAVRANAVLRGRVAILIARRYAGIPYVAGGTTPRTGFDCSGYTKYVYSQMGITIPRVSRDQYAWSRHISKAQAVPGDLIFFHSSSGRVYHAAIYAGHGYVWHSPHTGSHVRLERIWTSAYYVGRVRV